MSDVVIPFAYSDLACLATVDIMFMALFNENTIHLKWKFQIPYSARLEGGTINPRF